VCGSVTVQVLDAPATTVDGAHVSDRTPGAVVRVTSADIQELPSVALIVAVWSTATAPALTVKLCTVAPAGTATDAGAINAPLSLAKVTTAPAGVESVTLQTADPSWASVVGVQLREVSRVGVVSSIGVLSDDPLSDAVTVAFSSAVMFPAVNANEAVANPEATCTDDGAINDAPPVDNATVAPLVRDSLTAQVALAPECKNDGEHVNDVMVIAVVNVIAAVREDPLNDAVMVAGWSAVSAPTVAVKVAVVPPDGTDTDPSTVSAGLLLESATVPPRDAESVTVHVLDVPEDIVAGAQVRDVSVTAALTASEADRTDPFSTPVMVAVWSVATTATVAVKLADVAPAGIDTDGGTVTDGVLLESATVPPAGLVTMTTQVVDVAAPTGAQVSDVMAAGAVRATEADCEDPFREAVTVAV
jgi:hypothetical protein